MQNLQQDTLKTDTPEAETPFKIYPDELLYRHLDNESGQVFELKILNIDNDLDLFHAWHNQKYVYEFWELNKSKQELKEYLQDLNSTDVMLPVIGYIDGTPCAYFELYWAYYDRIAPFCDATLYDRGYHILIGNKDFLGRHNTITWLSIVNHFIFQDNEKTQRIVGEPRADNKALLKYIPHTSFVKTKEFDFPHKRAALLECDRTQFYQESNLFEDKVIESHQKTSVGNQP